MPPLKARSGRDEVAAALRRRATSTPAAARPHSAHLAATAHPAHRAGCARRARRHPHHRTVAGHHRRHRRPRDAPSVGGSPTSCPRHARARLDRRHPRQHPDCLPGTGKAGRVHRDARPAPHQPCCRPTAAAAADLEHVIPASKGGKTISENLTYEVRRWHNLKTHGGWTVQRHRRGWKWTSPRGRTYYTQPYDYRNGP